MKKKILLFVLLLSFLVVGALAIPLRTSSNQDYCESMLKLYSWKTISFPESFPIHDGLIQIEHNGPVAYVQLENNTITAAGCSVITQYNYSLVLHYDAAVNLLHANTTIHQYNWWRRHKGLLLQGTTKETKRNVRKLNRRARFFPWKLR